MDTIFMNSENSKTSEAYRLLLNLKDKINLNRSDKYVALSNISIYTWKNTKNSFKDNAFKISAPSSDHILYQLFKIISNLLLKNMK